MGGSGSEGPVSTPGHPHRDWRKALVTLHSGRSCRDTPVPLCSTAGTGPARQRGRKRQEGGPKDNGQQGATSSDNRSSPFFPPPQGRQNTHLCLHHGWPLRPQSLHCLEHVHHPLVAHPLQHDAERDEHACAPNPSTVQKEQEVPLGTRQPQRGSAELPGVVQASPAQRAQKPAQWRPKKPQGHCQPEVSPWRPPILPCLYAKLLWHPALPKDSSKGLQISTTRALAYSSHLAERLPVAPTDAAASSPPACLLLVVCRRGTKGRGVGSYQSKRGGGHIPELMKAEAGADLFPLTCSAP